MNAGQRQRALAAVVPGLYTDYLPPDLMDRDRDFFVYAPPDFLPLALGATATQTISIGDDAHFLICSCIGTVRTNAAPPVVVPAPALTVRFEDTGSGRLLQNRALDWQNIVGSAELPNFWPYPKLIDRGSTIDVTLTNNQGAAVQVRLALQGFKIFNFRRGT